MKLNDLVKALSIFGESAKDAEVTIDHDGDVCVDLGAGVEVNPRDIPILKAGGWSHNTFQGGTEMWWLDAEKYLDKPPDWN